MALKIVFNIALTKFTLRWPKHKFFQAFFFLSLLHTAILFTDISCLHTIWTFPSIFYSVFYSRSNFPSMCNILILLCSKRSHEESTPRITMRVNLKHTINPSHIYPFSLPFHFIFELFFPSILTYIPMSFFQCLLILPSHIISELHLFLYKPLFLTYFILSSLTCTMWTIILTSNTSGIHLIMLVQLQALLNISTTICLGYEFYK